MTSPLEPVSATGAPFVSVEPRAGAGARVAAALGAMIVLLGGALISFGFILFAPLGMFIGAAIWRKRHRVLSVVGHWLAALIGFGAVVGLLAAGTAAFVPKGSFDQISHTMDSATAVAAAERTARGTPADSAAARAARSATSSSRGMALMLAYGFGFMGIFLVAIYGTVGWIGGMLVGYAGKGRWPGTMPTASGSYPVGHA